MPRGETTLDLRAKVLNVWVAGTLIFSGRHGTLFEVNGDSLTEKEAAARGYSGFVPTSDWQSLTGEQRKMFEVWCENCGMEQQRIVEAKQWVLNYVATTARPSSVGGITTTELIQGLCRDQARSNVEARRVIDLLLASRELICGGPSGGNCRLPLPGEPPPKSYEPIDE